ncbi:MULTISPECIES: hypothetical protein [Thermococcus]|uniref:hypothetical protein n=1 Tax=Thermococcus TaxID=2263 RepID=UPI001438D303|nr:MULTISPECIES: hypothetical protein [Thermococcus]
MESMVSEFDEVFALANMLRTGHFSRKLRRRRIKGSWRELREYIEEYRDVLGQ